MPNTYKGKTFWGLTAARGGSKGVPGKNIKILNGKPLIYYTFEAAKEAEIFDKIILATEDRAIAKIGMELGYESPFLLPAELVGDNSPQILSVKYAVNRIHETEKYFPDYIMLLQATCPVRKAYHIKEAADMVLSSNADSLISVCPVPLNHHNAFWQFLIDENGKVSLVTGEPFSKLIKRRQELPQTYTRNGAIYIFKTELLFGDEPSFYGKDVLAYVMDPKYDINIDTKEDWAKAEEALKEL